MIIPDASESKVVNAPALHNSSSVATTSNVAAPTIGPAVPAKTTATTSPTVVGDVIQPPSKGSAPAIVKAGPSKAASSATLSKTSTKAPSKLASQSSSAPLKALAAEAKKRSDLTQPTLSQLARIKASRLDKKGSKALAVENKRQLPTISRRLPSTKTQEELSKAAKVPLPQSPKIQPAEVPLPPSCPTTPPIVDVNDTSMRSGGVDVLMPTGLQQPCCNADASKTPISSLVDAIQRGFMYTPHSPLSPPSSYAGSGEPWAGWPAGMGPFAQMLPLAKEDNHSREDSSPSPRTEAKWLTGLMPEEDSFSRPALADMDIN
ncbi:hypothetical protein K488DRAFT_88969 [Vararia minispora EC-137]|uniref:Uncharacterized protein n=1 Tax=Vararia minispora EC-137 TaxID=1314806 RepID=A0ACB8QD46_9AGAM|nr:hypothetical protein K488DRAFT_88969 [Vararia minispora EC-137]